jgi:hypothetical protein
MQNIVAALPNVSTFSLQNSDKKGSRRADSNR